MLTCIYKENIIESMRALRVIVIQFYDLTVLKKLIDDNARRFVFIL